MKVLQINSVCGYGSTGRSATELAHALLAQGDECYVAYGQGTTTYKNSFKIGTKIENHLHNACSRLFGKQGYYTKNGTSRLIRFIQEIQPDVFHLCNLHGNYLNLEVLFEYLAKTNKPIVWTLHDCWAFTGKCSHYTAIGCYKWQTQCNHCPQVKEYPPSLFFDRSEQMFTDKKNWFTAVKNMTIVPVSHWLAGEVKQSFLAKYPVVPIYNWIDQKVFKPSHSNDRKQYGIDRDAFIILGVSAGWGKDNGKLHDFIKFSKMLPYDMQVVLVGGTKEPGCIPGNIVHIPYVHETRELAKIYSMADVYVHLSTEDTFGKVTAEALACGTPAIVYNSTACPEVVGEGCGFVVEKRNVKQVIQAISNIKLAGKQAFSSKCTAFVSEHFNYQKNTVEYLKLYKKVSNI
ncbi:MAG: glycosyltransferase [Candidatus Brocadiaceae bacterium]|nr:glycosyltransferase [Candidatus Brocadiaceae bacterium]